MHEHLIRKAGTVEVLHEKDFLMDDADKATQEWIDFQDHGDGGVVDAQPIGCGRNFEKYLYIAGKVSEVPIIATTGYLKGAYFPPEVRDWSVNQIADWMIKEVEEGMDGTPHQAGVIKAGSSYNYISALEEKVFKAAVIASKKTGAPVGTHTEKGTMGVEQVELCKREGLDPSRMIIAHVDINPDLYIHRKIVSMGAYIVHDGMSKTKYTTDESIVRILRELTAEGFANRQLLSCDMGRRMYWTSYGGGPGFTYIANKFVPRLLDEGFSQETVDMFTTKNNEAAFAFVR